LREDRGVGKGLERTAHDEGQRSRQLHEEDGLVCPPEQGDCTLELLSGTMDSTIHIHQRNKGTYKQIYSKQIQHPPYITATPHT
jgi:hypothetical protein